MKKTLSMHGAMRLFFVHSTLFLDQVLPIFLKYFSLLSGAYISQVPIFLKNAGIIISKPNYIYIHSCLTFCLLQVF